MYLTPSLQVLTLCIIDAVGSLPEYIYVFDTNAYPLKYWDPERGGTSNHDEGVVASNHDD